MAEPRYVVLACEGQLDVFERHIWRVFGVFQSPTGAQQCRDRLYADHGYHPASLIITTLESPP